MGYTSSEANQLVNGGFISLLPTKIFARARDEQVIFLGEVPLNELNIANLPKNKGLPPKKHLYPGFILDRYYAGWFYALKS